MHCDPVWVSAIKALPTATLVFPWLVLMTRRGQSLVPSIGMVAAIAAAGLGGQVVGNVSFQYALTVLGVALTVPLTLGGMIVAATILGRVFLHEPVTPRAVVSLTLLLVAICVLSVGARDAGESVDRVAATPAHLIAAVAAGCLSGLAYAVLNVVIRYTVLRGMPLPTTLFTVSLVGILALSTISWVRLGTATLLATEPRDLGLMLLAGVCNTVAFLALTKSLQLTSVVYVNALNATQAMLAALAGVMIFGEAHSPWLSGRRGSDDCRAARNDPAAAGGSDRGRAVNVGAAGPAAPEITSRADAGKVPPGRRNLLLSPPQRLADGLGSPERAMLLFELFQLPCELLVEFRPGLVLGGHRRRGRRERPKDGESAGEHPFSGWTGSWRGSSSLSGQTDSDRIGGRMRCNCRAFRGCTPTQSL